MQADPVLDRDILSVLGARAAAAPGASAPTQSSIIDRARTLLLRGFQPLLVDPRNDCFVLQTILMLATVLSSGISLIAGRFWWPHAVLHLAMVLFYAGTYTAILHNTTHKPMYARPYRHLELIVPYLLGPVFGQTWNTYYYHHAKHHHVQNNGPQDLSSTLRYQRDDFAHFVAYFARFFFGIVIELPIYFWRRGQRYEAVSVFCGEMSSFLLGGALLYLNPLSAITVLVAPFLIVRFGMMSGNWAQHAFIDPADPQNDYRSSTICIHHAYNVDAYNDGYHTSHHLNPLRHWSEHPGHLVRERAKYETGRPIVLRDVDFMGVWWLLMTKNYTKLASLYVHLGEGPAASTAEIIALLKSRTQRLTEKQLVSAFGKAA